MDLNIGNLDSDVVKEPESSNAQGEHLDSAEAILCWGYNEHTQVLTLFLMTSLP